MNVLTGCVNTSVCSSVTVVTDIIHAVIRINYCLHSFSFFWKIVWTCVDHNPSTRVATQLCLVCSVTAFVFVWIWFSCPSTLSIAMFLRSNRIINKHIFYWIKASFCCTCKPLYWTTFLNPNNGTMSLCARKQSLSPSLSLTFYSWSYINFCLTVMVFCVTSPSVCQPFHIQSWHFIYIFHAAFTFAMLSNTNTFSLPNSSNPTVW